MAKNLATPVQVPGAWYGKTDKHAFEIRPDQVGQVTAKIPDDFRAGMMKSLAGIPGNTPSEAQVQTAYLLHLRTPPKAKP
jgi:hypothetical protein